MFSNMTTGGVRQAANKQTKTYHQRDFQVQLITTFVLFHSMRAKTAKIEPFARSQKENDCC
jgi:hypothetical protein